VMAIDAVAGMMTGSATVTGTTIVAVTGMTTGAQAVGGTTMTGIVTVVVRVIVTVMMIVAPVVVVALSTSARRVKPCGKPPTKAEGTSTPS